MKLMRWITRRLVQIKFWMGISYDWARTPALVTVALGVLKPYVTQYTDMSLWLMALLTTIGVTFAGFALEKLGIVSATFNYTHEKSNLLRSKFERLEHRMDSTDTELKEIKELLINKTADIKSTHSGGEE